MDETVNNDLDFILTPKTTGEAAVKVKDSDGDGWIAWYRVHRWHTTVTQDLLQEELKQVTNPTPMTRGDTIVDRLGEWESLILSAYGPDFDLRERHQLLLNALELLVTGRSELYEAVES